MEQSRSPHQSRLSSSVVAFVGQTRIRGQSRGKRYVAWCSSSVAHTSGPFNHSSPFSRSDGTSTGLGLKFSIVPSSLKWNKRGSGTRQLYQKLVRELALPMNPWGGHDWPMNGCSPDESGLCGHQDQSAVLACQCISCQPSAWRRALFRVPSNFSPTLVATRQETWL